MKAAATRMLLNAVGTILLLAGASASFAHGGGNWNEFTIDRVNDQTYAHVLKFQQEFSNVIRRRAESTAWPTPEMKRLRDESLSLKEEVDEILEHYVTDGINIQLVENIRAQPRIGRSLAAGRALDAAIALIDRAGTVEDRDAFINEFYAQGPTAYLYELVEAHRDRMDLYGELMNIVVQAEVTD